ncbi:MAG: hypothetical protein JST90_14655 [Bacteroidetes bacterium]|nr:hypothetical protein [Bacteroidota bacterium]
MTNEEIFPGLIDKILRTEISTDGHITVAELNTHEANGYLETIDTNTAIISANLIGKIKPSHLNPCTEQVGVNYDPNFIYNPNSWLYISPSSGLKKAEPLVISWCSGNHTTLSIDQNFLSTFKLTPRLTKDRVFWDDLTRPQYDIVQNKLLSRYDFPYHSEAYVRINKNYLEDYLYLRKKSAIQIFVIQKDIQIDDSILRLLGSQDYFSQEFKQYNIRLRKLESSDKVVRLEVNGYKLLFELEEGVMVKRQELVGHYWKGIEGIVTHQRARHELPSEYVYVLDEVLSKYESDEGYEVYPSSASVHYRNQWSVTHCQRIGKNGIRIEVKRLYEGTPYEVIDYWNKFSIDLSEIIQGENIAERAKRLTQKYFLFGRIFSKLFSDICQLQFSACDIITLNEQTIEYTGWSQFSDYNSIAHHINFHSFSKEQFISRCKKLYILIGENLKEKSLRKIINTLGFPVEETEDYRGIKLLELALQYISISHESGLDPIRNKAVIVQRALDIKGASSLSRLFALNSIRQLDAHKNTDSRKLELALNNFGIQSGSITNNYADSCERIYEGLDFMLSEINTLLSNIVLS